jgi:hypothetical protein
MTRKPDIKLIDDIVRRVGLSEDQREFLHRELRYQETLTYRQILELAREIKQDYRKRWQRKR